MAPFTHSSSGGLTDPHLGPGLPKCRRDLAVIALGLSRVSRRFRVPKITVLSNAVFWRLSDLALLPGSAQVFRIT